MEEIEELTPRGEGTSRSHQKQVPAIAAVMCHTINTPITPLDDGKGTSALGPNQATVRSAAMFGTSNTKNTPLDYGSTWSLDGLPEEVFHQWKAEAIEINRQAKAKLKIALQDTPPCVVPSTSKPIDIGPSRTASAQALRTDPDSSVTPNYIPPPTRIFKRGAALQSPYAEAGPKISLKCSRAMAKTYDAVCTCIRSTRTRDKRALIINYLGTFAVLVDLVDSVKPGGKLKNTIAEVGIYVLNGKKKRGATRFVMPLYVTTLLQNNYRVPRLGTP
ncbi:hypothetical protein PVAP13_4KG351900 [Panicum virgatum]|uniref:Uncharacterized protein n=1 Tax=Panicum virgatum TaxID=38727 RepID=A0A8T0TTG7_PANVG|nr:hypothetical protein PVAP13_4KG351900 [Panicum virgatum]